MGTLSPSDGTPPKHGTIVFAPMPGDKDRFVPDDEGGNAVFVPNNPSSLPTPGLLSKHLLNI
jgi:hypothetical protein